MSLWSRVIIELSSWLERRMQSPWMKLFTEHSCDHRTHLCSPTDRNKPIQKPPHANKSGPSSLASCFPKKEYLSVGEGWWAKYLTICSFSESLISLSQAARKVQARLTSFNGSKGLLDLCTGQLFKTVVRIWWKTVFLGTLHSACLCCLNKPITPSQNQFLRNQHWLTNITVYNAAH